MVKNKKKYSSESERANDAQVHPPPLPKDWDRCTFYMEQKRRYCRQQISKAFLSKSGEVNNDKTDQIQARYCIHHCNVVGINSGSEKVQRESGENRNSKRQKKVQFLSSTEDETCKIVDKKGRELIRIPCPIDPSHTIYQHMLHKHIKICPKRKQEENQKKQRYYIHSINTGGHGPIQKDVFIDSNKKRMEKISVTSEISSISPSNNDTTKGNEEKHIKGLEYQKELVMDIFKAYLNIFLSSSSPLHNAKQESKSQSFFQCDSLSSMKKLLYSFIPEQDLSPNEMRDTLENGEVLSLGLVESLNELRIKAGKSKHIHQQASILAHLKQTMDVFPYSLFSKRHSERLINACSCCIKNYNVIEMGAGRGILGLVVAGVLGAATDNSAPSDIQQSQLSYNSLCKNEAQGDMTNSQVNGEEKTKAVSLVLVERSGSRGKADSRIRQAQLQAKAQKQKRLCLNLENMEFHRIKCDLAHVYLPRALPWLIVTDEKLENDEKNQSNTNTSTRKVNAPETKKHVSLVIAKHLCGSGTDLALKSVHPLMTPDVPMMCMPVSAPISNTPLQSEVKTTELEPEKKIDACVFATCCHGICDWENYVGRKYLIDLFHQSDPRMMDEGGKRVFGNDDFNFLRKWSSGSTVNIKNTTNDNEEQNDKVSDTRNVDEEDETHASPNKQYYSSICKLIESLNIQELISIVNSHFNKVEKVGEVTKENEYNKDDIIDGVEALGRACQRIIDYGRLMYMKEILGFQNIKMIYYVPPSVTPQNCLLLAWNESKR